MTVSEFAGLESQVPATEARRLMDAAQAALYPNIKAEDARRLWHHWERAANPPIPLPTTSSQGARFYWNGRAIAPADLRTRLAGHLGAGLVADAGMSA
jgi:hypothetical protein